MVLGYDTKMNMDMKISGKTKSPRYTHLKRAGTDSKVNSKTDTADTLGEICCHNLLLFKYPEIFT